MESTSRLGRISVALVVSAIALVGASCSGSSRSLDGPIVLEVSLEAGQRWTAEGAAVESGALCRRGVRQVVRGIDPVADETVQVRVWMGVLEDAITRRSSTQITFIVENTCADGSGSFVTVERWGPDVWSVVSGTGAYRDLRGGGELSFATDDYRQTSPLDLYLVGVLEGEASSESGVSDRGGPASTG